MKLSDLHPKVKQPRDRVRPKRRTGTVRLLVDLSKMRRERGVTLRQVADALKISTSVLCQIENGCTPSIESALRIASFIGDPVEKIWALNRYERVKGK